MNIIKLVRPYTMVCDAGLNFAMRKTIDMIRRTVPGDIVECGSWYGGCALAMLMVQMEEFGRVVKPVHIMDSFSGLPPATERDGPDAIAWQADRGGSAYYDNCAASQNSVIALLQSNDFWPGQYHLWPGMFDETLPLLRAEVKAISLLRIDCDWYDSVRPCLDQLVPVVSKEGIVVLDDYYAWDGCARATHDFLAAGDHTYRLRTIAHETAAWFVRT